ARAPRTARSGTPQSRGAPGPPPCRTGSACIRVSRRLPSPGSGFDFPTFHPGGPRSPTVGKSKSDPGRRSGGELAARSAHVLAFGPADRGNEAGIQERPLEREDPLGWRPAEARPGPLVERDQVHLCPKPLETAHQPLGILPRVVDLVEQGVLERHAL